MKIDRVKNKKGRNKIDYLLLSPLLKAQTSHFEQSEESLTN